MLFPRAVLTQAVKRHNISPAFGAALLRVKGHNNENNRRTFHNFYTFRNYNKTILTVAGCTIVGGGLYVFFKGKKNVHARSSQDEPSLPNESNSLPKYTLEEVAKHSTPSTRIWITFRDGVYDITDFVPQHPGGSDKIMMAAGSSVDPFWNLYGVHKSPNVLAILEKYRIGCLDEQEANEVIANAGDPYAMEPRRHPALHPSSQKPFNAEPPPSLLTENILTPQDLFYVRNHLPVPEVSGNDYELTVSYGNESHILKLSDIRERFPKVTVTSAVMCAGNRRSEMSKVKPVKGLSWGHAAIGNATWSGARLVDVLNYLGYKSQESDAHVQFEGLDTDVSNVPYGASIPLGKALDPNGDVILAYEMNGEPLSRDHGYPVRAIVPGVVGARNVKWLGSITVSDKESDSHWQQNDYKGFSPSVDWDTVDFTKSPAIQDLPVISAICVPEHCKSAKKNGDGTLPVRGYAYSGGGRRIVRVDLTADGGKTWHVADLEQEAQKEPRHWGWTIWSANIPVDPTSGEVEIWAKAVDSSYNTQPESFENIWNLRGVLGNAYHRVRVTLE